MASIVGVDGSGKSSTFRGVVEDLASTNSVAGVGDVVLTGGPDEPLRERDNIPSSRLARLLGRAAKSSRISTLYKNLKFIELAERTRITAYLREHERRDVIVTDGDPLVNTAAWSIARFYQDELVDDDELLRVMSYLAGEQTMAPSDMLHYFRRSWQLVLLNRLHLARFDIPNLIILLEIDPATAIARIRARGKPLQAHETEAFLDKLGQAYERSCRVLESKRDIPVFRIPVATLAPEDRDRRIVRIVLEHMVERHRDGLHTATS